jgi:hypothetical protein
MTSSTFGKSATKNAIESKWSGSYVIKGIPATVKTTVTDLATSIIVGRNASLVIFKYQTGTPNVDWESGWSKAHPGTMYLFPRENPGNNDYSRAYYMTMVAHEFGHILGIRDGYRDQSTMDINSIMCDPFVRSKPTTGYIGRKATYKDIQKALSAYKSNTVQSWYYSDR